MRLDWLCPDIAMTGVPVIDKSNIELKGEIGRGHFGVKIERILI
jgi:hypothetical protein